MNRDILCSAAKEFGLALDVEALIKYEAFMRELVRWNRSINLTAITGEEQIIIKHFIDSLSIAPHVVNGGEVLDVGSGAGLPGLALAIARNDLKLTSIDAVDKKVRFQRHICRTLPVCNAEVLHGRIEDIDHQYEGRFDMVVSRAFCDIGRLVPICGRFISHGGRMLVMHGGKPVQISADIEMLIASNEMSYEKTIQYQLPKGMGERHIVVLKRNPLN